MKKSLLLSLLLLPLISKAANLPCSGSKGGVNHCEGSKFICNDGTASSSTKDCSAVMGVTTPSNTANTTPVTTIPVTPSVSQNNLMKLDYDGFTVWLDCEKRGAVKFQYNAQRDTGSFPRVEKFTLDFNVPAQCQQTTANAYGKNYDRGHLVPANHLDYSASAIKATNNMTNILPQAANMNRGAWLQTEEIIECYRDISELLVIGGVIWGNNSADDYFLQSHGVKTPDAFWKVIVRGTGQSEQAIAWIVPNSQDATRKNLDKYLVTVHDIERITGEKIPVPDYAKDTKPSASWLVPKGCDKS
jgi:endonuclease G